MLESTARARGSAQKVLSMKQGVPTTPPKNHGRAIFVYSNIYTNQVVYSLERSMNNASALKQLTFAGKNTVPRALRKDLWRPLCTVLFPDGDQGRHAFQKLREWRRLHEVDWDKSEVPEIPEEKQRGVRKPFPKQLMISALPNRIGGQRVQHTTWDMRRRKMILDQRAASIADLAAVLAEQDRIGQANAEHIIKTRQSLATVLVPLADSASKAQIGDLEKQVSDLRMQLHATNTDKSTKKSLQTTITDFEKDLQSRRHIRELLSRPRTEFQRDATNSKILESIIATLDPTTLWRMHQERAMGQSYAAGEAQEEAETARRLAVRESRRQARERSMTVRPANIKPGSVPRNPTAAAAAHIAPATATPRPTTTTATQTITAYISGILAAIRRGPPRTYTTQGVEIKWTNPLDAEYATEWPRAVTHGPLGYARHTAPPALARTPRLEVQDGLFDIATGRFVGAASRLANPQVQRYNREKSWRAEAAAAAAETGSVASSSPA